MLAIGWAYQHRHGRGDVICTLQDGMASTWRRRAARAMEAGNIQRYSLVAIGLLLVARRRWPMDYGEDSRLEAWFAKRRCRARSDRCCCLQNRRHSTGEDQTDPYAIYRI